ncbi:MAG: hypothetical protein JWO36_33 [Myxococcales bacterium]|nr:hypothetical protein [Myxococcales bacterium]
MKNLVFGVLLAGLFAACSSKTPAHIVDAGSGSSVDGGALCNVLAQTGCDSGQKCTWLHDATMPTPLGHIGCAPNGTAAVGASCTYGADGATGFDTCVGGLVCQGGKCKTICDQQGGAPMCGANFSCSTYEGLFGPAGQTVAAGVCDPSCNPLADNDIDGSGSAVKTGSACPNIGSASIGCYGYPDSTRPSRWSCTGEVNKTVVHKSLCTTANGCANAGGNPYLNGCAQGYLPLLKDMTGGTGVVCVAVCSPGNTYVGANPQAPAGVAPHRCNSTEARGNFTTATTTTNGDHCLFSWWFEVDAMNNFVRSPTSDTVGFCVDHTKYQYASVPGGTPDTNWPICAQLPDGNGSGSAIGAADFGCVNTMHAMLPFNGKAQIHRPVMDAPRMMYHHDFAPTE